MVGQPSRPSSIFFALVPIYARPEYDSSYVNAG